MGSAPTKTHIPNRNGTKKGSAVSQAQIFKRSWDSNINPARTGTLVMVWLPSCGLFCGRLAGVMFCAFLGVLEVPVLAGLMLPTDLWDLYG
jgi:hypothetical protein